MWCIELESAVEGVAHASVTKAALSHAGAKSSVSQPGKQRHSDVQDTRKASMLSLATVIYGGR